jgi:glycerophosphoryl diester phosphodiesterase
MRERATFLRPIAHRGLHDAAKGIVENTPAAFAAAIAKGYGIECDLRPAGCSTPMVFHDLALDRLVEAEGPLAAQAAPALKKLRYRGSADAMLDFPELLELVGGRVPLLIEIKSEWAAPDARYLEAIASAATAYRGPVALMSFDPAVMTPGTAGGATSSDRNAPMP